MRILRYILPMLCLLISLETVAGAVSEDARCLTLPKPEPEMVIQPEDVLNLFVYHDRMLTNEYRVEHSGEILLPFVGPVEVAGQNVCQVEETVQDKLSDILKSPSVEVLDVVRQPQKVEVFLAGCSPLSGAMELNAEETLLQFLARTNSIDSGGDLSRVMVFRQSGETFSIDIKQSLETGDRGCHMELMAGDVVYLPKPDRGQFEILGHVRRPGSYSITEEISLFKALGAAGGLSDSAAYKNIQIRSSDGKTRVVDLSLSLRQGCKTIPTVAPGDVIYVPKSLFHHWKSFMRALIPIGDEDNSVTSNVRIINGGSLEILE